MLCKECGKPATSFAVFGIPQQLCDPCRKIVNKNLMLTAEQLFEKRHAWTGGGAPTDGDKKSSRFKQLRRLFFREQLSMCGGLDLWVCAGTSSMERARIFWDQATLDAWSTIRQK